MGSILGTIDPEVEPGCVGVRHAIPANVLSAAILGHEAATVPAQIVRYERRRHPFHRVARAGAETDGLVPTGLDARDCSILDRYEEVLRLYTRERTTVIGADGAAIGR